MATDKELVKRFQNGESEAYAELFRRYYRHIYTICVSLVKNPQDAEELAPITKELAPLDYRGSLISARLGELADEMVAVHRDGRKQQQLQAEIQQLIKEQDEIEAARRPYLALNEQLVDEFDQHLQTYHDMTYQEFQDLRTGPERETWIAWLNTKQ